jgi:hypothetical protein
MNKYCLILIKLMHLLVNRNFNLKKKQNIVFFFRISITEKARANNGRVFIHCLGKCIFYY